eukprot:5974556-Amphidinium_carterae.1
MLELILTPCPLDVPISKDPLHQSSDFWKGLLSSASNCEHDCSRGTRCLQPVCEGSSRDQVMGCAYKPVS